MIAALVLSSELLRAGAAPDGAPPAPAEEVRMHLSRDEESIRGALAAFTDAVNRGDYGAVLGMVTDDAVFWTENYPAIRGRAAIEKAYAGLAGYRVHQDFEIEELQVCGEWAFVRGYEDFTLDPKDGKGPRIEIRKRRAISILRRQPDGTWKTARGMTNSDAPPASPQTAPR